MTRTRLNGSIARRSMLALMTGAALSPSIPATAQMRIRLGHVFAINSPVDEASRDFARLVAERTNGEIGITLFPAGQLGGDEALARELSRGSLDLAFLNPGSLAGLDQLLDIHYLPYIATNFREVDAIFFNPQGVLLTTLRATMARHRMQALAFFELEFRGVTNSRRAVERVGDLRGLRIRVPGSIGIRSFFEATGAHAVTMPFPELFTALQQGTVDGQDNGPNITFNSRLFEAQRFMTMTNHVYANGAITASERLWARLSAEQRRVFLDTAAEVATRQIQRNRELNAGFLQRIAEGGVRVTTLSPEAMAEFQRTGMALWDTLAPTYGVERVKALREEVARARRTA